VTGATPAYFWSSRVWEALSALTQGHQEPGSERGSPRGSAHGWVGQRGTELGDLGVEAFDDGVSGAQAAAGATLAHRTIAGENAISRSNFPNGTLDISRLRGASILKPRPRRYCIATSLMVGTSKEILSMPRAYGRASAACGDRASPSYS
jgi:hypothetical protein